MNSYSHIHVSYIIIHKLKEDYGISLPKAVFTCGNFRPDFSIKYHKKPHYREAMYQEIQTMLRDLAYSDKAKRNIWYLTDRLGVICHYMCDFFCYAHTDRFDGTFHEHVAYEMELNHYIKARRDLCKTVDITADIGRSSSVEDLLDQLEEQYRHYIALRPNCGFDLVCSLQVCIALTARLLQIVVGKSQVKPKKLRLASAGITNKSLF